MAGESRACYASTVRFPSCGREPKGRGHNSIEFRRHNSEGETPGPIPNPEAKPFSADGTALVTGWESRTPPDIFTKGLPGIGRPFVVPPTTRKDRRAAAARPSNPARGTRRR